MSISYRLPRRLQGPPGLHWLWRLVYGHGFLAGWLVALILTPVLMQAISTVWTGHWPSWDEHFKSFVVGDPLLAIAIGIIAVLVQKDSTTGYLPSSLYWLRWLGVGVLCSVLFILREVWIGLLNPSQLLEPHIFYHHVLLVGIYVPLLLGMAYVQYRRNPRSKLWIIFGLLLASYLGLVAYDNIHPPYWV